MQSPSNRRQHVIFGPFEADLSTGKLYKLGNQVHLQDQPFRVLAMLLEHPGEVVTREEARKALWPEGTFVDFDEGLDTALKKLRHALGDSAQNPNFIETIPRRGYRLIGSVGASGNGSAISGAMEGARPEAVASRTLPWKLLIGVLALAVALAGVLVRAIGWMHRSTSAIRSIAVLPLENLSGDASQDYFADGLTDELITHLGQIGTLRVISRTSVMQYKGVHKPLPQVARELGVDAVVEGTVLRSGDKVRITAQLIQAASDRHLWARTYVGDQRDVLSLQNEVASAIASEIRIKLTPQQRAMLKSAHAMNPQAQDAYLKGHYLLEKGTIEDLPKGISYFGQAIEKEPFALAYAGMASGYVALGHVLYLSPQQAFPPAKTAALKALELDNGLEEAHTALGDVKFLYDWDFPGAEREFQLAIQINPSSVRAQNSYADFLNAMGHPDDAIAHAQQSLQIDPLSLSAITELGWQLYFARRYDEAIAQARKVIEVNPNYFAAHVCLGLAYEQKHEFSSAIAELQKATGFCRGRCAGLIGQVSALSGDKAAALEAIKELQQRPYVSPWLVAIIYAELGDREKAFEWLEKSYSGREHDLAYARVWPMFDSLRSDPRYNDIMRRIGLTK
jgi:TolB-like protein/DNA-binding winged helix-turn-helix (wHTH) protein/Tfp pilus assembly protein PilF